MIRYLENERYAVTCDICGDAEYFIANSMTQAHEVADNIHLYRVQIIDGLRYAVCDVCNTLCGKTFLQDKKRLDVDILFHWNKQKNSPQGVQDYAKR